VTGDGADENRVMRRLFLEDRLWWLRSWSGSHGRPPAGGDRPAL